MSITSKMVRILEMSISAVLLQPLFASFIYEYMAHGLLF